MAYQLPHSEVSSICATSGSQLIDKVSGKFVNEQFYGQVSPGQIDYWKEMAGPRHRISVLIDLLKDACPNNLVDLGCGNGELLGKIQAAFPSLHLTGVDLSLEQINSNKKAYPDIVWRSQDLDIEIDSLPEFANSFEAVIASEIIEHVSDPHRFLETALKITKPNGRLLISTQSGPIHETERRVGHVRHFSRDEFSAMLSAAGWEHIRVWNTGYPFHDWSKWYANLNPDRTMREFSEEAYSWKQRAICWALRLAFKFNSSNRGYQLFAVARKRG